MEVVNYPNKFPSLRILYTRQRQTERLG